MNNEKGAICSIIVSKEDILDKRIKPTLGKLNNHKGEVNNPLQISVSGYDGDKRELYQIPEVRSFFRALLKKRFKNLLSPKISYDTIYIFLKCAFPPSDSCSIESFRYQSSSIILKSIKSSSYGPDLASHIAISVFSQFEPGVGIASYPILPSSDEDKLIQSFLEGGMPASLELARDKEVYIRVKNFNFSGDILISFYFNRKNGFKVLNGTIKRNRLDDLDACLREVISETIV